MANGMKKFSLSLLALAVLVMSAPTYVDAKSKRPFPTPQAPDESIQQSIARIHKDEQRAKKTLVAIERRQIKLVGKKTFEVYKAGNCAQFKCSSAKGAKAAAALISNRESTLAILKDLADEKSTLLAMVKKMNAPLKNNKTNQPGVSTAEVAGAATPAPAAANQQNPYLPQTPAAAPVGAPGTAPAAAPGAIPGDAPATTAPAQPSSGRNN